MKRTQLVPVLATIAALATLSPASAAPPQFSTSLQETATLITGARVGDRKPDIRFLRNEVTALVGINQARAGVSWQYATKLRTTDPGVPEHGVMLHLRYDFVLMPWMRVETAGRLAISPSNQAQPLYASDTDAQIKLAVSDPDGVGRLGPGAFHPSGFAGVIVNKHLRVQAVAGVGLWWMGINVHGSAVYALNGVKDPMTAGSDADVAFAKLRDASIQASIAYDSQLGASDTLRAEVRHNFPIFNAGRDWVVGLTWKRAFGPVAPGAVATEAATP